MQFKLWRLRPWSPSWKLLDVHFCWISFLIDLFFWCGGYFWRRYTNTSHHPHKDVCSTIGMGFLDSTLTYIDDIDWLVPPRMPVTIRICHYHCLLRGIPINPPFRYRDRGRVPPKTWKKWWSHRRWLWTKWRNMPSKLGCGDLVTGSKIPSPNEEFLETSWEFHKLSNSQGGYPVRGRGQYQTPWYMFCNW